RPGLRGRSPDAVERVLQLGEYRGGAHDEQDDAEGGGHHALGRLAGALEQALHRGSAFAAQHALQLAVDLPARGFLAEHHAGDGDDDQQERRDREHRVERERRAHALRVVVQPIDAGPLEQIGDRRKQRAHPTLFPQRRPSRDRSTAIGRVPANSESTMVIVAVIGTARKAPAMPHSADQTVRLTRIANGLRLSLLPNTRGSMMLPITNWTIESRSTSASIWSVLPYCTIAISAGNSTPRIEPT